MQLQRVNISLNVVHPTDDLSRLGVALGLQPHVLWAKGDKKRTPKGNEIGGCRNYSRCTISFGDPCVATLSTQIAAALLKIQPHRKILQDITDSGGKINFFIGLFCVQNTIETLGLDILKALVEMRIELVLDIYSSDNLKDEVS
jgi:hypothetical protein